MAFFIMTLSVWGEQLGQSALWTLLCGIGSPPLSSLHPSAQEALMSPYCSLHQIQELQVLSNLSPSGLSIPCILNKNNIAPREANIGSWGLKRTSYSFHVYSTQTHSTQLMHTVSVVLSFHQGEVIKKKFLKGSWAIMNKTLRNTDLDLFPSRERTLTA